MPRKPEGTEEERRARRAAQQAAYDKRATKGILIKLNRNTDADILTWLEGQQNRQGYLKRLIRDDIARAEAAEE